MDTIKRWWFWLLHGNVVERIVATEQGFASEISFRGRQGYLVGWWSHGRYEEGRPFVGQPWVPVQIDQIARHSVMPAVKPPRKPCPCCGK